MANVRGLSDFNKRDSDDEDRQDFYAGGEKSGMVVQGPTKRETDNEAVASLFDRARDLGAEEGNSADLEPQQQSSVFSGTARTLAGGVRQQQRQEAEGPANVVITFYENGVFTVNDGPPRSIADPANRPFIDAIGRGEVPAELDTRGSTAVSVHLVRKAEEYKEPEKPRYQAFQGAGRTLARPTEERAAASSSVAASAASVSSVPWEGVDESQPQTSIQLRLHDGSRMVAKFNHTHTVADIRRFIRAARPDMPASYTLMTAPPMPKTLTDDSVTIADAGLLQSCIMQRL